MSRDPDAARLAFRQAMAQLVSGVCVVTARASDGTPCGLLATSLCSYSADPPAVLVCVGRGGRARSAIAAADVLGVHLLRAECEDLARWFGVPGADRFGAVEWEWDDGVPALGLDQAMAYLRCVRAAVMHHGDHTIVIGEVERVELAPSEPLVYARGRMDWRLRPASANGREGATGAAYGGHPHGGETLP